MFRISLVIMVQDYIYSHDSSCLKARQQEETKTKRFKRKKGQEMMDENGVEEKKTQENKR